jgi:hypothetical protein
LSVKGYKEKFVQKSLKEFSFGALRGGVNPLKSIVKVYGSVGAFCILKKVS